MQNGSGRRSRKRSVPWNHSRSQWTVEADDRRLHREQHGKGREFRLWINGVAKSNIDLHRYPGAGQDGVEFHAYALVLVLFLDSCSLDRFAVEENAVIPFDLADGPN